MYLCAEVYRIPHTEFLRWDEGDRQKAIAWEIRRRQTCPSCGTRNEEWEDGKRPYVPTKHTCIGCRELEKTTKTIPDKARGWIRAIFVRAHNGGERKSQR
jgi:hypothetical protein